MSLRIYRLEDSFTKINAHKFNALTNRLFWRTTKILPTKFNMCTVSMHYTCRQYDTYGHACMSQYDTYRCVYDQYVIPTYRQFAFWQKDVTFGFLRFNGMCECMRTYLRVCICLCLSCMCVCLSACLLFVCLCM